MTKFLVVTACSALLVPTTAISASATPRPPGVEMSTRTPDRVEIGQKVITRVKASTDGDVGAICTGSIALVVKRNDDVVKRTSKPVDRRVTFKFKLRQQSRHRIVAKYEIGEEDPCVEGSRSHEAVRVIKRGS